jgi:hypothetical protein
MSFGNNRKRDDHGVSESIGFMLMFTIIIVGIGLVTLYGYPMLLKQQVNADLRIMEKNLIVLQNDFKSITYKSAPYKETSLKVGGGRLTIYNTTNSLSTSSRFHVFDSSGFVNVFFYPGQLQYESINAQQVRAIENGAVVSRPMYTSGSVMLAEPRWFSDTDPITGKTTTVISLVGINSTIHMSQTGVGTVRMQILNTTYMERSKPATLGSTVTVEYRPDPANDYSVAWRNYIVNTLRWTETATNTYQPPSTDTLVIKQYNILIKSI